MQTTYSQTVSLIIVVSTLFLLIFVGIVVRNIFLMQQKRYLHEKELMELRESFNLAFWQSKLEIQEQTLDHIVKELHANFSPLLSYININLSEMLEQNPEEVKTSILETKTLAKQLMSDLKTLSAEHNTDFIMQIGFVKALQNELAIVGRLGGGKKYRIDFIKAGEEYRLNPEHEIILLRLCQEVLNNSVKYAEAASIRVGLDYSPGLFRLEISDDGIGFDAAAAFAQNGDKISTGLVNIRKRARLINGQLSVRSTPGEGTCIVITIPKQNHLQTGYGREKTN